MTVRITEAELANDIHSVLARVREGDEVIIEQDHRPVAVIKTPPQGPGRKLSECIARAKAHGEELGYAPVPDPDFATDVQAAIDSRREPFHPPAWD
jgi:antitoxin (DNA-binding transcriptional repressor) of toxin-antitoxin stability system